MHAAPLNCFIFVFFSEHCLADFSFFFWHSVILYSDAKACILSLSDISGSKILIAYSFTACTTLSEGFRLYYSREYDRV